MNGRWIQGLGTALLPPWSGQSTPCKGRNEVQTLYPGTLLKSLSVSGLAGAVTHLFVKLGAQKRRKKSIYLNWRKQFQATCAGTASAPKGGTRQNLENPGFVPEGQK